MPVIDSCWEVHIVANVQQQCINHRMDAVRHTALVDVKGVAYHLLKVVGSSKYHNVAHTWMWGGIGCPLWEGARRWGVTMSVSSCIAAASNQYHWYNSWSVNWPSRGFSVCWKFLGGGSTMSAILGALMQSKLYSLLSNTFWHAACLSSSRLAKLCCLHEKTPMSQTDTFFEETNNQCINTFITNRDYIIVNFYTSVLYLSTTSSPINKIIMSISQTSSNLLIELVCKNLNVIKSKNPKLYSAATRECLWKTIVNAVNVENEGSAMTVDQAKSMTKYKQSRAKMIGKNCNYSTLQCTFLYFLA